MKNIAWFSTGVSSAVAIKYAIEEAPDIEIYYTHIEDQHPDSMRFLKDCQEWFGREVKVLQSPYKTVESVIRNFRYVNGVAGAPCTKTLKRRVRKEFEREIKENITYWWGMDYSESHRADRLYQTMPEQEHRFPLIENKINKTYAHQILEASGIKRPKMYDLGYHNNNCIGCVKGGMGYWNKIRVDFPEIFESRAKLEREIGATCIKGVYLDELDPNSGRHADEIMSDCGILCELIRK